MKKTILTSILWLLSLSTVLGQSSNDSLKQFVTNQSLEFSSHFGLTEEARLKSMQILWETNTYLKEIAIRKDLTKEQKNEKSVGKNIETDKLLLKLLSPEQQKDFDKFKAKSINFNYSTAY